MRHQGRAVGDAIEQIQVETLRAEWRTIALGAFAPLASFALFHLVTVFPISWITLFTQRSAGDS